MERRTWATFNLNTLYPNLFVILTGGPSIGKGQSIGPVRSILADSRSVLLSPDDMTKAALVDTLVESKRRVILARGEPPVTYHSLCITATEFGTLISAHDVEFLNTLNKLYDCEPTYSSRRRGHNEGKVINIDKPGVSILAGTQPGYLGDLLPESAWIMGFTSRLILVYASGRAPIDPFAQPEDRGPLRAELIQKLQAISRLVGEFRVEPDVQRAFKTWVFAGLPPVPEHSRLANYTGRRDIHVMKLSMIAAAAARCELRVTLEDYERARSWLLAAERDMPDIFRDMHMKNDNILTTECHRFVMELWTKSAREVAKRAPVHRARIFEFLSTRCPVEKAQKVLELMTLSNWLAPVEGSGGLLYVPKPRTFGQLNE